jgi:predicted kinase
VGGTDTRPQVIIFTGLPGTGKSTLAEQVARAVGVPAFAADWLMGAIKPTLARLERSEYLAVRIGLLGTLVTRQLMLGQGAVVDALVSESEVTAWRKTAVRFPAHWYLIECICSDEVIHRQRIEGRIRGIPGWHEVGWDFVERMRAELAPLTADRLIVDAMEPVADNLRRVLDYLVNPAPAAGPRPAP